MRKALPLLSAAVLLASGTPRAVACPMPPLSELVKWSDYVALVRDVGHRDAGRVRVTEYEVVRALKGAPPSRFVRIEMFWERQEGEPRDEPQPTGSEVLFLTADAVVRAPWKDWEAVARATNGLPVLDGMSEPVLLWRGVVGIANPDAQDMVTEAARALNLESTEPVFILDPLELYLDALAALVEQATQAPPPEGEAPPIR